MATHQSETSSFFFFDFDNLQDIGRFSTANIFKKIENAEQNFDYRAAKDWMAATKPIAALAVTAYVLMVIYGPKLMKNRDPVKCQWLANLWNTCLAIFSCTALIKTSPEFFGTIKEHGIQESYCQAHDLYKGPNGFWVFLFHISKMVELGDTVFLVLKKRPILFMHSYHHALVLADCWFIYSSAGGLVRWGGYMNLVVHSAMYTYFAVQGITHKLPRYMAKMVTTLQIVQFVIGTAICVDATRLIFVLGRKDKCDPVPLSMAIHLSMYISFLALFVKFFYHSYISKSNVKKQ